MTTDEIQVLNTLAHYQLLRERAAQLTHTPGRPVQMEVSDISLANGQVVVTNRVQYCGGDVGYEEIGLDLSEFTHPRREIRRKLSAVEYLTAINRLHELDTFARELGIYTVPGDELSLEEDVLILTPEESIMGDTKTEK
jgi:hypothetical protein